MERTKTVTTTYRVRRRLARRTTNGSLEKDPKRNEQGMARRQSEDDDQLVAELRKTKTPERAPWVIGIIRTTRSPRVRNAAAIALADMKFADARDILVALVRRKRQRTVAGHCYMP